MMTLFRMLCPIKFIFGSPGRRALLTSIGRLALWCELRFFCQRWVQLTSCGDQVRRLNICYISTGLSSSVNKKLITKSAKCSEGVFKMTKQNDVRRIRFDDIRSLYFRKPKRTDGSLKLLCGRWRWIWISFRRKKRPRCSYDSDEWEGKEIDLFERFKSCGSNGSPT